MWNQVFCGDPGAPAQSFASNSGLTGGPPPYTTLGTCPVTQEAPYLYADSSGNYNVFVPSVRTNSSGPSWADGNTPGTSLPLSTFYVVNSASTVGQINAALAAGDNLLFTPGVYNYAQTINVTKADTKIVGLGFATLVPTSGNTTMSVADVSGVNVSGLIFDAGPTTSPALLQVGTAGLDTQPRRRPGQRRRRVLPRRRRDAGSATDALRRQQQQLADRRRVGRGAPTTAPAPARGRPTSAPPAWSSTATTSPPTASPSSTTRRTRSIWNGQGGTVDLLPEREPVRGAQPGIVDGQLDAERLPGASTCPTA